MSDFTATVTLTFSGHDSEDEARQAVDAILRPGLEMYASSYGIPLNKPAALTGMTVVATVPPLKEMTKESAAKLVSRFMSVPDRQSGVYAHRGKSSGAFFLLDGIMRPALKQLKADHLFEFYHKAGTSQVLVRDILDNVIVDFAELPDKVMELADFMVSLSQHYIANEELLGPFMEARDPLAVDQAEEVDQTSMDAERAGRGPAVSFQVTTDDKMAAVAARLGQQSVMNQQRQDMMNGLLQATAIPAPIITELVEVGDGPF